MKFPQGFEVQLLKPSNGAAYPDIAHGVERYVVGVPDQPFEVRVTVPTSQFISQYIRVTLSVDGRCVGVSNIVSLYAPSATFSGFISTIHGQNLTRQFLFGKAAAATGTGTGTGSAPDINKTGGIEVKLTAVSEAPGYVMPVTAQAQPGAAAFKAVEGMQT